MKKLLFVLISLFVISGCSTLRENKPETIITTKNVLIIPPEVLIEPCSQTKPFKRDYYKSLNKDEQNIVLSDLISKLYGDLENCNNSKKQLKEWYLKQEEIYK